MLTRLSLVFDTLTKLTASMLTLMLSLVMTSWRETSKVTMRLSCLRKASASGHLKKNPGPTSLWNLPNRSMMASSHSLLMANVAGRVAAETIATIAGRMASGEGNRNTANMANSTARNKKKAKGAGEPEYSSLFFAGLTFDSSISICLLSSIVYMSFCS